MLRFDPEIPAHEHGVLRLFGIDTSQSAGRSLKDTLESGGPAADRALADALGVDRVEAEWTSLVSRHDIAAMGMQAYLAEGHGVPVNQIVEAREALDAAGEHILVVPSRSFDGAAQHLEPHEALQPIAVFDTAQAPQTATPMTPAQSAPSALETDVAAPVPERPGGPLKPWMILGLVVLAGLLILVFGWL